jgi:hypothetical protein
LFNGKLNILAGKPLLLIIIPLALSAFTHLWNPVGFPAIHVDEGHYMRRAMQVLQGFGPQESMDTYYFPYDHPYFGQLFLAGVFKIIGYPDILDPKVGDVHSIEMLYLVPRVLMGLLAVLDTFLIYKIAERKYNRTVAFIAAVLFAVMPLSLLTRGIFLESILLPFLLGSILFALYSEHKTYEMYGKRKTKIWVLLSGLLMGLAIFTKIPVFMIIPLVAIIIIKNSKNPRTIISWLIPVVIVPMLWPTQAILTNNFDEWLEGVLFQTSRESMKDLRYSVNIISGTDPVLLALSVAGFVYSQIRGDYFVLLWIIPLFMFLFILGWVVHFHWILFIPAFCIVSAGLVETIYRRVKRNKVSRISLTILVLGIIIFGSISTINQIISNQNSSYIELYAYIASEIRTKVDQDGKNNKDSVSVIGPHRSRVLLWIPMYVSDIKNVTFIDTDIPTEVRLAPITTKNILIIVDNNLRNRLIPYDSVGNEKDRQLSWLYHNTHTRATFINKESDRWKYMTIGENYGLGRFVEVRANYLE